MKHPSPPKPVPPSGLDSSWQTSGAGQLLDDLGRKLRRPAHRLVTVLTASVPLHLAILVARTRALPGAKPTGSGANGRVAGARPSARRCSSRRRAVAACSASAPVAEGPPEGAR